MNQGELEQFLGGPARLTYEDIAGHPRMPEARHAYIDHFLALYEGDPFMARLVLQAGRFFVLHLVLVLESAVEPMHRETWPTIGLLKQKLSLLGVASERQIDHVVRRMIEVGFLEIRRSEQDRRVRLLSSTEKSREHDRDWLIAHYAGLALLYPQHDYGFVMRRDPSFQRLLRANGLALMPLAMGLMAAQPHMMLFFENAGAYPVFATLIKAASSQPDGAYVRIPYADVGVRFGVSRTQVRKLLMSAEKVGLVRLHARGGQVEILPEFWPVHDRGIAVGMYVHELLYLAVSRAMQPEKKADAHLHTSPPIERAYAAKP